jgi:hypothetical protein
MKTIWQEGLQTLRVHQLVWHELHEDVEFAAAR